MQTLDSAQEVVPITASTQESGEPLTIENEQVQSRIREMEDTQQLFTKVIEYHHSDNHDLRDKYIEKILIDKNIPAGEELFLRWMQGKVHLVDLKRLERQFEEWKKNRYWSELARAYWQLGQRDEAIKNYCLTAIAQIEANNPFTAGYYLKEMIEHDLVNYLFEKALQDARGKNDVWWQIRSLQELGREDEIDDIILRNQKLIERDGRPDEMLLLRKALKRQTSAAKRARNL